MVVFANENNEKGASINGFGHLLVAEKKHDKCKMKWLIGFQIVTTILVLLMIGIFCLVAYPIIKETQILINGMHNDSIQNEKIVTLYALDPLARTFCFDDGKYGHTFSDWSVYNRRSDIDFNNYYNGNFTIGIEGGSVGAIIDLGTSADLQEKYKYQETVGNGQGFASIHRKNKTILIAKDNAYNHIYQTMEESVELFRQGTSGAHASVKFGHIYILRVTGYTSTAFERIVKMSVIAYKPNESVTIRWEVLP